MDARNQYRDVYAFSPAGEQIIVDHHGLGTQFQKGLPQLKLCDAVWKEKFPTISNIFFCYFPQSDAKGNDGYRSFTSWTIQDGDAEQKDI